MNYYLNQLADLQVEALSYIRGVLNSRGSNMYELIDPSTYMKDSDGLGIDDEVYELPRTFNVDKYQTYCEYVIIGLSLNEIEAIRFHAIGIGEISDEYVFDQEQVDTQLICSIADLIYDLEN